MAKTFKLVNQNAKQVYVSLESKHSSHTIYWYNDEQAKNVLLQIGKILRWQLLFFINLNLKKKSVQVNWV